MAFLVSCPTCGRQKRVDMPPSSANDMTFRSPVVSCPACGAAIEIRAPRNITSHAMKRCTFDHRGMGPRCCIETETGTHDGPHRFKCAGTACPGLIWPASVMTHPISCISTDPVLGAGLSDGRLSNATDRKPK